MRVIAYYAHSDLREEEWPKPEPGRGTVRVRVTSVCICGSDLTQYATGSIGDAKTPVPFVLGHEAAGTVDAVGPGVKGLPEGTPVAIEPAIPCNECEWCRAGRRNICPQVKFLGAPPVQGALAEFVVVPAENVLPVKARVTFAEIACIEPLAIGIYTARLMRIGPGDTVAIFGAGALGQVCLMAAKASGARVIAATDRVASRLAVAHRYGAEQIINIGEKQAAQEIMKLTGGRGVDVAIEAAGALDALRDAVAAAAVGGRVALLGIPHETEWQVPASFARRKELAIQNIRRSNATTATAVQWVERGMALLAPLVSHRLPWDKAEQAFDMAMARAEGTLRISLEPGEPEEPFHP
jgi:L-iditol 2-dehydrogenase